MGFWRYFSEGPSEPVGRWKTAKYIAAAVTVFLIVPFLLYYLIKRDPVIYVDEWGDPVTLGVWVLLGLYWVGAYLAYNGYKAKIRLEHIEGSLRDQAEKLCKMERYDEADRLLQALNERGSRGHG